MQFSDMAFKVLGNMTNSIKKKNDNTVKNKARGEKKELVIIVTQVDPLWMFHNNKQ